MKKKDSEVSKRPRAYFLSVHHIPKYPPPREMKLKFDCTQMKFTLPENVLLHFIMQITPTEETQHYILSTGKWGTRILVKAHLSESYRSTLHRVGLSHALPWLS